MSRRSVDFLIGLGLIVLAAVTLAPQIAAACG